MNNKKTESLTISDAEANSKWVHSKNENTSEFLAPLLQYAHSNYSSQTDWFLRHRDFGTRTLSALLASEFAIVGFHFEHDLNFSLTILGLLVTSFLSILFTQYSLLNCKRSFTASLENALFVTKIIWASGWADKIHVTKNASGACPAAEDPSFYVPRYLEDARALKENGKNGSTEAFVNENLNKSGTSYRAARLMILPMGIASCLVSFGVIFAILIIRIKPWG